MWLFRAGVVAPVVGRGDLTNDEWARLKPHLPKTGQRGGRWKSHRRVIDGILFRERTGVPWRDLPARFGKWKTVYERHRRWSANGTWDKILRAVQADADAARPHRLVHGERGFDLVPRSPARCRGTQEGTARSEKRSTPRQHRPDEGLGRSRGGLTCKIHLAGEGGRRPSRS